MLRQIALASLALALSPAAWPAIWPEQWAGLARGAVSELRLPDAALAEEYGFQAGEKAVYGEGKLTGWAWRAKDSTGALAIRLWLAGGKPAPAGLRQFGNYVFAFEGAVPPAAELEKLYYTVPRLEQSSLPALAGLLPGRELVADSPRYILGPASLAAVAPAIPPSAAGFHFGTEGEAARYRTSAGELLLVVFSYPSHQIARAQLAEFQKLPGAMVKRDGPLVAIVPASPNADAAEVVLARVKYRAEITWNEKTPNQQVRSVGSMIMSVFVLAGILLAVCLGGGLLYAGIRLLRKKLAGAGGDPEEMIVLHIGHDR
jgi:hypothetical protein